VSAAERSWDGRRVKKFDADEIIAIAAALGIPLTALFLPPEDAGTAIRYVLDMPGAHGGELGTPLAYAFPAHEGDSPAMDAYRKRVIASGASGREIRNDELAKRILELAQQTAEEAIDLARAEADATFGRARSETEVILGKAVRQAEQITADARARAQSLERDAQERHRQAMGSLVQTREELERRVDDLRSFEREYRTRLQAFLEGQLKDLWEGVAGMQVNQAIGDLRKRAARHPGQRVSAVVLREDGTYDVIQFSPPGEGGTQSQEEPQTQWDPGPYAAPEVAEYGGAGEGKTRRREKPPAYGQGPYPAPQVKEGGDSP
jgi:vacuolar-type H+-ATPase subunit E/Vma4